LVRVHVGNALSDVLHWQRVDFGVAVPDVLRAIAQAGSGVMVVLNEPQSPDDLLARLRQSSAQEPASAKTAEWRRTGAGAQILADIGLRRLRVLGTPRRQVGLGGFGLEVVEYVELPSTG
jgi:3,4-dihydroxy 2-butanone 4-phosphate synthase/GTP cyclohydrolase II